ncbi:hypothetical protein [Marinicauda pacifica]|uniref:hypothetical protein n=1 Tax=Marinicauda pacifica TaxID=1133559 RepID=UPI0035C7CEA7
MSFKARNDSNYTRLLRAEKALGLPHLRMMSQSESDGRILIQGAQDIRVEVTRPDLTEYVHTRDVEIAEAKRTTERRWNAAFSFGGAAVGGAVSVALGFLLNN